MRSTREQTQLDEATRYRLLKLLQDHPDIGQRELAREMGVSLGKLNYCLRALISIGLVKAANFRSNPNKNVYSYLLTSKGIQEKANVTARFLQRKLAEYELVQREIEQLRREVQHDQAPRPSVTPIHHE